MDLGTLTEKAQGTYELTVGNHLLKGKIQNLQRPMILAQKEGNKSGEVGLNVQAVVRRKILFSTRPTPLKATAPGRSAAASSKVEESKGEKRRNLN